MVGLSDLLEAQKSLHRNPQVINKTTMIKPYKPPSSSSPRPVKSFLDECFLCNHRLFPGCDIYMYNGDRAFCSVECRNRQIMMDEEENHFTRQPTSSSVHPRQYAAATETNRKCRRVASQFCPLFYLQ